MNAFIIFPSCEKIKLSKQSKWIYTQIVLWDRPRLKGFARNKHLFGLYDDNKGAK